MGIAIIVFLLAFAVWGVWTTLQLDRDYDDMLNQKNCNHDCNQGRQCDCQKQQQVRDDFDNDHWPFPTDKKP